MHGQRIIKAVAAAGTVVLATTACLSSNESSSGGSTAATAKKTVEIMFGFGNDQTQGFKDSLTPWATSQGITIKYTQSASFDTQIQTRVAGGDLPDIAAFPQPGILKGMATKGKLQALDTALDMAKLKESYLPGFLEAGTVDGKVYGVPVGMNVKSLYWYDKANFAKAGYTVPKTHDELLALIDKVKSDGKAPLCVGLESGGATGWPGTDWIEDYVLQVASPEDYDAWVAGKLKFSDPKIKAAFDIYAKMVLTPGNTYGGRKSIVAAAFGTALNPLFKTPPGCYMGKQGNFITQKGFFPSDVFANLDSRVGVFVTPPVKGQLASRSRAAATLIAHVRQERHQRHQGHEVPRRGPDLRWSVGQDERPWLPVTAQGLRRRATTPNQTLKDIAAIGAKATGLPASTALTSMPGTVGSGSLLEGHGRVDMRTSRTRPRPSRSIDDSWPSS